VECSYFLDMFRSPLRVFGHHPLSKLEGVYLGDIDSLKMYISQFSDLIKITNPDSYDATEIKFPTEILPYEISHKIYFEPVDFRERPHIFKQDPLNPLKLYLLEVFDAFGAEDVGGRRE
jgi:hypothetical protein